MPEYHGHLRGRYGHLHRVAGNAQHLHSEWGQEVFRSTALGTGWDGRSQGALASDGTYFWVVRYAEREGDAQSEPRERRGHLTLLGRP